MKPENVPFRLLAIVNRVDLTEEINGVVQHAGEANLTFGVRGIERIGGPEVDLPFNVIFEFQLAASDAATRTRWARNFSHADSLEHGHKRNAAIAVLTEGFAQQAHFLRLRSNENALAPSWEFRQFERNASNQLTLTPLPRTPDLASFNLGGPQNSALADYMSTNAASILAETHELPAAMLAGRSESISAFQAAGSDQDVRHKLSMNTCMGCHFSETDTNFRHIRAVEGRAPLLSPVLLQDTFTVPDPVNPGRFNTIDILAKRKAIIEALVNPPTSAAGNEELKALIEGNKMRVH